jgi:hypothetical protein
VSKKVYVVGGGPSLRAFNWKLLDDQEVIAVNAAIYELPWAKYFVTVDYSYMLKMRAKQKFFIATESTKVFVCGMHHSYLREHRGAVTDTRSRRPYDLRLFQMIIKSHTAYGCGFTFKDFRSGENSGYCGLQLAVLLGYDEIYLLGMDFIVTKQTHFHDYYTNQLHFERKLSMYQRSFEMGIADIRKQTGIQVVSCSSISSLNNTTPYVPVEETL